MHDPFCLSPPFHVHLLHAFRHGSDASSKKLLLHWTLVSVCLYFGRTMGRSDDPPTPQPLPPFSYLSPSSNINIYLYAQKLNIYSSLTYMFVSVYIGCIRSVQKKKKAFNIVGSQAYFGIDVMILSILICGL